MLQYFTGLQINCKLGPQKQGSNLQKKKKFVVIFSSNVMEN